MGLRSMLVVLGAGLLALAAGSASAADVTVRMRGSTFEIKGELVETNARGWLVLTPGLGTLMLDNSRYECVAGPCDPAAVAPAADDAPATSTWIGGSAIGTEFMPRLIKAYALSVGATVDMQVATDPKNLEFTLKDGDGHLVGRVDVARQGVPQGFSALATGKADVVWTSRAILPEEEQMMANAGIAPMRDPRNQHLWALDALVVLVARENPVVSLSLDNIARIFAGEIKDWGELGLPPGKINVYAPTSDMGTWSYFDQVVMKPRNLVITPDAVRLAHATDWSDRVAADPAGISINSIAYLRRAKAVNIEMSCGMVVPPSIFTAKTHEYPLARPLYFYSAGRPKNPLAAALLDFALSSKAQAVLKDAHFVDREPESAPFIAQSSRIAVALNAPAEDFDAPLMSTLIAEIRGARRLSLTYRFETGGATLDNRGADDIARLANIVGAPELAGKTIMLLGFSDSVGQFASNLRTASRRSQIVRSALLRALAPAPPQGVSIVEAAYGELAPVACNDNDVGRALNRRVEVWIK